MSPAGHTRPVVLFVVLTLRVVQNEIACSNRSDKELARRKDMINRLKQQSQQATAGLSSNQAQNYGAVASQQQVKGVETEQTSSLDNRGLLSMQRNMMAGKSPLICITSTDKTNRSYFVTFYKYIRRTR